MADTLRIYRICTRCAGTGQATAPSEEGGVEVLVTCPDCDGKGAVHTGWVEEVELEEGESEPPLSEEE